MRGPISKSIFAAAFAMLMVIVLIRTFAPTRKDPPAQDEEEEKEEATKTPSHVVVENGKAMIKLSPEAQQRLGLKAVPLHAVDERPEVAAPALVLDVQGLVNLTTSYAAALANLRKAENNLSVSQSEYDRLKTLYARQQNVSAKAFQAGAGMLHNDQTDVRTARQNLKYQTASVLQNWGDKIARWVTDDSPSLNRILNRQDMLVQVTLPADGVATAPGEVSLEIPNGVRAPATLVSRFPRIDPRIQGASFLFVARAQGALEPGLNLIAHLPAGPRLVGVVIPSSAVVWWKGEAWVYEQTAASEFTRRMVPTDRPVAGGFFVSQGFSTGDKVVTRGAQQLFAIESSSELPAPSAREGDED
jgi:hypothetical protein